MTRARGICRRKKDEDREVDERIVKSPAVHRSGIVFGHANDAESNMIYGKAPRGFSSKQKEQSGQIKRGGASGYIEPTTNTQRDTRKKHCTVDSSHLFERR